MKKGRTIDPDGVYIREETYSLIFCYYLMTLFYFTFFLLTLSISLVLRTYVLHV